MKPEDHTVRIPPRKRLLNLLFPRYSPFLDRLNWTAHWIDVMSKAQDCALVDTREAMFRWFSSRFFEYGHKAADYFEFGVFQGEGLTLWSALNKNPQSRLFGFDSFEGIPGDFNTSSPAGHYTVGGKLPEFQDERIRLVKGLFQDSLPSFLESHVPRNPVVIHNDSDLYSSTLYTLMSFTTPCMNFAPSMSTRKLTAGNFSSSWPAKASSAR
jgi:hypothetical protein